MANLHEAVETSLKDVWKIVEKELQVNGKCNGCGAENGFSEKYNEAVFSQDNLAILQASLAQFSASANDEFALKLFDLCFAKYMIQVYIDDFLSKSPFFSQLASNAPIAAVLDGLHPLPERAEIDRLRHCLDVLFHFMRRRPPVVPAPDLSVGGDDFLASPLGALRVAAGAGGKAYDQRYYASLATWIRRLGAVLLPCAAFGDHVFVLRQLVNTGGIGSWAAPLFQFPPLWDKFTCEHVARTMRIILQPQCKPVPEYIADQSWVILDHSSGPTDTNVLSEDDMIALFQQIPFQQFCCYILSPQNDCGVSHLESVLIIICEALYRFSNNKHFAKLLSRTVVSLLDTLSQYPRISDPEQLNLDTMFLIAVHGLLPVHNSGVWQFLCGLPFTKIQVETAWYFLCLAFNLKTPDGKDNIFVTDKASWENVLSASTAHRDRFVSFLRQGVEALFVVQALVNLASANDCEFAQIVLCEVFYVSFIETTTRSMLYKVTAGLLSDLCTSHPACVSNIVKLVAAYHQRMGKQLVVFVVNSVNMSRWEPTLEDMDTVKVWLLKELGSDENKFAQCFLDNMNWKLSTPAAAAFTRNTAFMVLEAWQSHTTAFEQSSIFEFKRPLFNEFDKWCWSFILRLSFHTGPEPPPLKLADPEMKVMAMHLEAAGNLRPVLKPRGLPVYLALQLTDAGLSPESWNGVQPVYSSLRFLIAQQHIDAACWVLHDVLPVVLEHLTEEAVTLPKPMVDLFTELLASAADLPPLTREPCGSADAEKAARAVAFRMAQLVGTRVVNEADQHAKRVYSLVWFKAVCAVPNWHTDERLFCFVDTVVQACYLGGAAFPLPHLQPLLKQYLADVSNSKPATGWLSRSLASPPESLIPLKPSAAGLFYPGTNPELQRRAWFLFSILFVETQQDSPTRAKLALKQSLDKAEKENLKAFQWAHWALCLSKSCALLPVFWQMFFLLYFDVHSGLRVATRLHSKQDSEFQLMIADELQTLVKYFSGKVEQEGSAPLVELYQQLTAVFGAMTQWVKLAEAPSFSAATLDDLPPSGLPQRLRSIVNGSPLTSPELLWMDLVAPCCPRLHKFVCEGLYAGRQTPQKKARTQGRQFMLLDEGRPPPQPVIVPPVANSAIVHQPNLRQVVVEAITALRQDAQAYNVRMRSLSSLDDYYVKMLPQRFRTVFVKCQKDKSCKCDNRIVHFCYSISKVEENSEVMGIIKQNRIEAEEALKRFTVSNSFCSSALQLQLAVNGLINSCTDTEHFSTEQRNQWDEEGCAMFFALLDAWNDDSMQQYPPATLFVRQCLQLLATAFISSSPKKVTLLLQQMISHPERIGVLCSFFIPTRCPSEFVKLFQMALDAYAHMGAPLVQVVEQFRVEEWLRTPYCTADARLELLGHLCAAMCLAGAARDGDPVWQVVLPSFVAVAAHAYPSLVEATFSVLLRFSDGQRLPADVWVRFVSLLQTPLPAELSRSLLAALRAFLWQQRDQTKVSLFFGCNEYVEPFCTLMAAISAGARIGFEELFGVYEPWLCVQGEQQAWDPSQCAAARTVLRCLVSSVAQLWSQPQLPPAFFDFLLRRLLAGAAAYAQTIVFEEVLTLNWGVWLMSTVHVAQVLVLLQNAAQPAISSAAATRLSVPACALTRPLVDFIARLLTAVNWIEAIRHCDAAVQTHFIGMLLQLELAVLYHHPPPVPQHIVQCLRATNMAVSWSLVPVPELEEALKEFVQSFVLPSLGAADAGRRASVGTGNTREQWDLIIGVAAIAFGVVQDLCAVDLARLCGLTRFIVSLFRSLLCSCISNAWIPALLKAALTLGPSDPSQHFFGELVELYNLGSGGAEWSNVHGALCSFVGQNPRFVGPIVAAVCRRITGTTVADITELCCEVHLASLPQWKPLLEAFSAQQPERRQSFIEYCVSKGYLYTLFVAGYDQLRSGSVDLSDVATWYERVPLAAGKECRVLLMVDLFFRASVVMYSVAVKQQAVMAMFAGFVQKVGKMSEESGLLTKFFTGGTVCFMSLVWLV
eukprot:TRINITY_DN2633_c0_g1_i2.p1 TRINITY_DN2633_c0_g1~~TRINITY_DN2633_c0_g1_i2.p1  ORF type:complete len:2218 (-),score=565.08 TRINITY_DN2633_c0_g1_i2:53-6070(-)